MSNEYWIKITTQADIDNEIKRMEMKDKEKDTTSKLRLKSDRIEITWKDGKITSEKAESISLSDRRLEIEYENETTVIFFKNIRKVRFPSSLSDKKVKQEWTWNPNLGYYDDTSTIAVPSWYINYKIK